MSTPFDPRNAPPRHQIGSSFESPAAHVPPGEALPHRPEFEPIALPSARRLSLAFLAGAAVSLLGALLWAVVVIATGYNIGFLAGIVGAATGLTIVWVARGPVGVFERVLASVFAAGTIVGGYYVIGVHDVKDGLDKLASHGGDAVGYLDTDMMSSFVHHFGDFVRPIDWLWIAIAAYAAFRVSDSKRPLGAGNRSS